MRIVQAPAEPLLAAQCALGEGPVWEPATSTLHFVDIGRNAVHHLHLPTREHNVDHYDACIGSIVLRRDAAGLTRQFVACARRGFAYIPARAPESTADKPSALAYFAEPVPIEIRERRMLNDSACDSRGRLFAGAKTVRGEPFLAGEGPGVLYRLEKEGDRFTTTAVADGFSVPNGIGFSPDDKTLYMSDTRAPVVLAFDYDVETGALSNRRTFASCPYEARPDGLCVDADGFIWVAKWAGAKVSRYAPDGTVDLEIVFENVLYPTAPCFGGPDMDTLFVTSGSLDQGADGPTYDAETQRKYARSGDVFAIHLPGIRGVEKKRFAW